ncbi:hypothetical protein [Gluconobacter japonicus]|uniref:hypothetical protein n=1 Tax=Gluconobacter japonicus TaxID=376620 RepID=UPI001B8C2834|nr:hypothetical protein [Gluconobacter japonicus]MBS1051135.1 hypothetical protein [Gluconobacter japonicus]
MIAGATLGRGGSALAHHLADSKQHNEVTSPGLYRGLISTGIRNQVKELTGIVSHARSNNPLLHVHANPDTSREWTESEWGDWWQTYEDEFSLQTQAFHESIHIKNGRTHKHRTYSLVKPDGTCIKLPHQQRRHEKLSRLAEIRTGSAITKGAHNHAVLNALEKAGFHQEISVLKEAGIHLGDRARAGKTPKERAQEERTAIPKETIDTIAYTCWTQTRNLSAEAFQDAVEAWGLSLVQGDKVPVLLDVSGNCHPILRAINAGSKDVKNPQRLKKKELDIFLSTISLSSFRKRKIEQKEENSRILDKFENEDYNFNIGDEYDTAKQNTQINIRNAEVSQRPDKSEPKDLWQHIGNTGFDTKTRRRSGRPNSGDKKFIDGIDIKPERDKRNVAKNLAKARLRSGLQESHLTGILLEFKSERPTFKIKKFDAYLISRIKKEIKEDSPDMDFLQTAYFCMSIYYVRKYPKGWKPDTHKEEDILKALLELALSVLNIISQFLFGVSFVEASHEFDDDLAYDVRKIANYKNKKDEFPISNMTTP